MIASQNTCRNIVWDHDKTNRKRLCDPDLALDSVSECESSLPLFGNMQINARGANQIIKLKIAHRPTQNSTTVSTFRFVSFAKNL